MGRCRIGKASNILCSQYFIVSCHLPCISYYTRFLDVFSVTILWELLCHLSYWMEVMNSNVLILIAPWKANLSWLILLCTGCGSYHFSPWNLMKSCKIIRWNERMRQMLGLSLHIFQTTSLMIQCAHMKWWECSF